MDRSWFDSLLHIFSDVSHKVNCLILGIELSVSTIGDRNRKLVDRCFVPNTFIWISIFVPNHCNNLIPQFTLTVIHESDSVVLHDFFDCHIFGKFGFSTIKSCGCRGLLNVIIECQIFPVKRIFTLSKKVTSQQQYITPSSCL